VTAKASVSSLTLSSVEISLNRLQVPQAERGRGQKWVLLGNEHQFMPRLLALLRKSTTASAIIDRKVSLIAGEGFKVNLAKLPNLAAFLKKVARTGRHRTGNLLLKRVVKDYERLFGFAIQVVWSLDGGHIAELHHERFELVAPAPMNQQGDVESYYICRDWNQRSKYKPIHLPAFNPDRAKLRGPAPDGAPEGTQGPLLEPVQLFYYYEDEPGVEYFPALGNEGALPYIEMEADLAQFHSGNVASNFSANTIIQINKGPEDETKSDDNGKEYTITAKEKRDDFEKAFANKYQGATGKRILFLYGDGTDESAEKMAKITVLSTPGAGELYSSYAGLAQQAILSAASCTSPMIAGLPSANGGSLGGNGQELYQGFKLFFNTGCKPHQNNVLAAFKELFSYVNGVSFEGEDEKQPWLSIAGSLPVEFAFSEQLMELIMTDDELRARMNLDPLPAGAKTAAEPATPASGPTATPSGQPGA